MSRDPSVVACTFEGHLKPLFHAPRLPVAGSVGRLVDLRIFDDCFPNSHIKRVTEMRNLRAPEGITALYESGIDVYRISELLSAGLLGTWRRRRIIPTKSAIVIVDTTLSDHLFQKS